MTAPWQLYLYGDFRLFDSTGSQVLLPNRKVEGLLAVLCAHRRFGMERDEVAEILWPGRPLDAQRANLRQALAQLRKGLGPESIESSRSHCRLSDRFPLECDYDRSDLRTSVAFMPGHEGEWFEEVRLDAALEGAGEPGPEPSMALNFLQMLRWYADRDPRGMFALLMASPALARGVEFREMLDLLNLVKHRNVCPGWAAYWRGTSEDDLLVCAQYLRTALEEAKRCDDVQLASEVCLELGKVYARTGKREEAMKICAISDQLAKKSRSRSIKANAYRLSGTVLIHWSDGCQGLGLFERAEDLIDDPIEKAIVQSSRAFFEASVGHFEKARDTLASPLKVARETGHKQIESLCRTTQAQLTASSADRSTAVAELEALASHFRSSGRTQLEVYAEELLAKLFYVSGDKGLAQTRLRSAQKGRSESHMVLTNLESKRLLAVR